MADVWNAAGIDIVSLASNHAMDWGPEALLDTIELFRGMGKIVIGAGKDADEARKPAIVERNGVKIAILAYCSVLRDGQAAGKARPALRRCARIPTTRRKSSSRARRPRSSPFRTKKT